MRAYACTRSDSGGMLLPVYVSLRMHEQYASQCVCLCECIRGDPQQRTLWTESRANLVWHLWRPWDNLHDTATDRSGDIDLKSGSSKIRFLCVLIGPQHLCGNMSLWAQLCVVIKDLMMETPTTLQCYGPLAWPPVPFLPPSSLPVITETFLSSFPALPQASPLIPVECVECWTGEPSSQAAGGEQTRGNEQH